MNIWILLPLGACLAWAAWLRWRVWHQPPRCQQCGEPTDPAGLAHGRCLDCRLPVETPEQTAARRARLDTPDGDRLLREALDE